MSRVTIYTIRAVADFFLAELKLPAPKLLGKGRSPPLGAAARRR
jgi:hypothetical protein